jgi:hypothetical protein
MKESLQLFGDMLKNETLKDASVILFFNKKDLFREKIKQKNITSAFPSYTGKLLVGLVASRMTR